jgi:hypothetical protein
VNNCGDRRLVLVALFVAWAVPASAAQRMIVSG